jgi:SpoVK/Ycf46/Vps4 family AAA+-type ATPase
MDPEAKNTVRQLIALSKLKIETGSDALLTQLRISGLLFFGAAGTGKTHLCRAMANDSGQTLIAVSAAELNSKYVGETEKMIRSMFRLARKLHPCIIFLDEADSLFYKRTPDDKQWERSAVNQYLVEMDGLGSNNTENNAPLVIVATNRPADLDEAFLRRLPYKVYLSCHHQESANKFSTSCCQMRSWMRILT